MHIFSDQYSLTVETNYHRLLYLLLSLPATVISFTAAYWLCSIFVSVYYSVSSGFYCALIALLFCLVKAFSNKLYYLHICMFDGVIEKGVEIDQCYIPAKVYELTDIRSIRLSRHIFLPGLVSLNVDLSERKLQRRRLLLFYDRDGSKSAVIEKQISQLGLLLA